MLDEQEFRKRSEDALSSLNKMLIAACDDYGFEVDYTEGALKIEFEDPPTRFVVSPNAPVRQIWISANVKSFKLDWDPVQQTFVLGDTGKTLKAVIEAAIGTHIGGDVHI